MMEGLSQYYIYILIGAAGVFWIYLSYIKSDVPKKFRTPLYLFTKRGQVYRIDAENSNGLMLPDKGPGYVEIQPAVLARRWGRVWNSPLNRRLPLCSWLTRLRVRGGRKRRRL